MSTFVRPAADSVGIVSSALCMVHCLLVPASFAVGLVGPFAGLADESVHRALVGIVVPAAAIALGVGFHRHRDRSVIMLGMMGLVSLIASFTILHEWLGEVGEKVATVGSAGLLIAAHIRNGRRCRPGVCVDD